MKLETLEDYNEAVNTFVQPFLTKQVEKIAVVINEMHTLMNKEALEQEEIDHCINEIKQLSIFASPNSPMNPYFQNIVKLEQKLFAEGLLK